MLKILIIVLGLLSLSMSDTLHCSDAADDAKHTYNTEYMIPDDGGEITVDDKFEISQRHLHNYLSSFGLRPTISVLIYVVKQTNSSASGQNMRVEFSDQNGPIRGGLIPIGYPIYSFQAVQTKISVIADDDGVDKLFSITLDQTSDPPFTIVAGLSNVVISSNITLSNSVWKVILKDDIIQFSPYQNEPRFLVKVNTQNYVLLTNKDSATSLTTILAEVPLTASTSTSSLKCYTTRTGYPICFDLENQRFHRYNAVVPYSTSDILPEAGKTAHHIFRAFIRWSVISYKDSTQAIIGYVVEVYRDKAQFDPISVASKQDLTVAAGNPSLAAVSSGFHHMVEYHQDVGLRFIFTTTDDYLIQATAAPGDDIFAELDSEIYSWDSEENFLYVLLQDKIVHFKVIVQGLDTANAYASQIPTGEAYYWFVLTEGNDQFVHSKTLTLADEVLTEIADVNNLLTYFRAECICVNEGAKMFKCFTNGLCLMAVDYDEVQCNGDFSDA